MFPAESAIICISICLGSSMNFSIKTRSSPKLEAASLTAARNPSLTSFSLKATRMPFPPPPAEAFIMTGNPISAATLTASLLSASTPTYPGTVLTPAPAAIFLDSILSPMAAIAFTPGPMNVMPSSASFSAKVAFSERNP